MRLGGLQWWSGLIGLGALVSCGGRPARWETRVGALTLGKLDGAAVLVDTALDRALLLTPSADQQMRVDTLPVGQRIAGYATAEDRSRFFIMSAGAPSRLRASDEPPQLTVIDSRTSAAATRYDLPDALTAIALRPPCPVGDPRPTCAIDLAILYATDASAGTFITNPNELLFVDLHAPPGPGNPTLRNLPSNVGGAPKRLTFSPPLHFPGGDRSLLVVETDRDVMLLDLDHLDRPEITVPISDARSDARAVSPAGIALFPGGDGQAPVLAVRTTLDDNVLIYTLGPSGHDAPQNDFAPTVNTAFVGGVPSDLAFVRTNQGMRLAVMVPTPSPRAVLVKVDDGQTLTASLSAGYQRMSVIANPLTTATGAPPGDRVLLWAGPGGNASSVALWDLDKVPDLSTNIDTVKSVETLNLRAPVTRVGDLHDPRKRVLETVGRALYVLDLDQHTTAPLTTSADLLLDFAADGSRAWAFQPGTTNLAQITLAGPHVRPLVLDRPVDDVLEVTRADGGKTLMAVHGIGGARGTASPSVAVTLFDAPVPDAATSRRYSSLTLEGLDP